MSGIILKPLHSGSSSEKPSMPGIKYSAWNMTSFPSNFSGIALRHRESYVLAQNRFGMQMQGSSTPESREEGLDIKGSGTAKVVKGVVTLASLNGQLTLKNATLDGRPYGNLELTANTRLPMLALAAKVNMRGVQLEGTGDWRMDGDYPGQARIQIPRITFATLHDLWPGEHERKDLPFEGFIQGEATLAGPLNNPAAMTANIALSTVQLSAGPDVKPVAGTQIQDLVLKNAQPVMFEGTTKSIELQI